MALTAISRLNGKNMPGYRRLWAIPMADVTTIPAPTAMDVATALTLVADKVFTEIEFDFEGGAWLTTETPDAEGSTGYRYNLQGFVAGNTAAIRAAVETHDGVYCILVGEQQNGVKEILGEVNRGLRLKFNFDNGAKAGNRIGYAFRAMEDFNHLPYTYSNGTVTE